MGHDEMGEEDDVFAKHAERRRAFLAKTAATSPVVGLLLAQADRPARAATYGGGSGTTTPFQTPSLSETTAFTFVPTPTTQVTVPSTIRITQPTQPTTILFTVPTTIRITQPTTILFTLPTTIRIT
jgi:hypothetical protein